MTVELCTGTCVFGIGLESQNEAHYKLCSKGQGSLSESLPSQRKNDPIDLSLYPQRTSLFYYLFITPFNLFNWTLQ